MILITAKGEDLSWGLTLALFEPGSCSGGNLYKQEVPGCCYGQEHEPWNLRDQSSSPTSATFELCDLR